MFETNLISVDVNVRTGSVSEATPVTESRIIQDSSGTNIGVIVGSVLGGVVFLAGLSYYFVVRQRAPRRDRFATTQSGSRNPTDSHPVEPVPISPDAVLPVEEVGPDFKDQGRSVTGEERRGRIDVSYLPIDQDRSDTGETCPELDF